MTKIKCEWVTCLNNDATNWSEKHGYCTKQEIELKHVDNDEEDDTKYVDGLNCISYVQDLNKLY